MAVGGPCDHPLTNVINDDIEVYGKEADALLKQLAPLMSRRELREWWEKETDETDVMAILHRPIRYQDNLYLHLIF